MDFFTVPTVTFSVLYCLFVISHDRRRILHFNVTKHPTSLWIIQQLREAFPFDLADSTIVSLGPGARICAAHERLSMTTFTEIEQLNLLIANLRRMQFGRKSEKLDWQIGQLELKNWRRAGRSRPLLPLSRWPHQQIRCFSTSPL